MASLSMSETSSVHSLPMRYADFPTLVDALDYAALGNTGMNFYDRRNQLVTVLEYRTLQQKAISGARRLLSLKLKKAADLHRLPDRPQPGIAVRPQRALHRPRPAAFDPGAGVGAGLSV